MICPSVDYIAIVVQVLDFSLCVMQYSPFVLGLLVDSAQIALGALMCLLVVIQFIRESLQMYKATKRLQLSRYTKLLVREGMIYFLTYVHVPPSFHFLFHANPELL